MKTKVDPELRQAMERVGEPQDAGPSLTKAELLEYHLGDLAEAEAEAIRERLLWDESAQRYLLSLVRPNSGLDAPPRPAEHLDDDWQTLQKLLVDESTGDISAEGIEAAVPGSIPLDLANAGNAMEVAAHLRQALPQAPWFQRASPFQALAAGLLLVVLFQTWRVGELRDELEWAYRPGSDVLMTAVSPLGTTATRDGNQSSVVVLSKTARRLFINLNYSGFEPYERFSAQLTFEPIGTAEGSSWQAVVDPVTRSAIGTLEIDLAGPWLAAGELQIELSGVSAQTTSYLASYRLRIVDD